MKTPKTARHHEYDILAAIPFILLHLSCLGIIFTGFSVTSIILAFVFLIVRMWGVTAGYHRYFSHKSFKTSRTFQFILAFIAQSSAQQGVIWWANHHRQHHQFSDTPKDVHSPRQDGFWHSHVGWIFTKEFLSRDYHNAKDWEQFPELRWLDRHRYTPAIILGAIAWLIAGWQGVFVGFILSTIVLYHFTFFINSLSHVYGKQRYLTADDSRNNWWLAILTLGEGWHNNHHHFSTCARQGFRWWEIDITYYVIKLLEKLRIVWDVREPPRSMVKGEQTVPQRVKERTWLLFDNHVNINFNQLSLRVSAMAKEVMQSLEQPRQQLAQELSAHAEQVKHLISEKRRHLKQLPPKVAVIVQEKFAQLLDTIDVTLKSLDFKERLQHCAQTLEDMAQSIQLTKVIPERVSVKSVG
ncbi:MAG: acyl-CoA desaturase [Legionellales bacterium]|nr:acyl-CoA desaturase [Legionellales bacterium]